jgi:dephospho-CoA kinase
MTEQKNVKIIAFVGLTGSGKSSAVEYLTNKGYPKVYFGGVLLKELDDRGLAHTEENERTIREALRASEGKDFIVKRIVKQIDGLINSGQHRIVADGIYSWTEYKVMRSEFPGELSVVSILGSRQLRHHRLNSRPIRPLTDTEANERDQAEIENMEKGGPIAIADYFIVNDSDLEKLHQDIDAVISKIDF